MPEIINRAKAEVRLQQFADGVSPYKPWRGEAPEGEPTLKRDLLLILAPASAAKREGERPDPVTGATNAEAIASWNRRALQPHPSQQAGTEVTVAKLYEALLLVRVVLEQSDLERVLSSLTSEVKG